MGWKEGKDISPKEYPGFIIYPFYHKAEKMCWAKGAIIKPDATIVWLSGQTGRDPATDRQPRDAEDERRGAGKVVGQDVKSQCRQTLKTIKESLEDLGASMEDIYGFHYYVVRREDWHDFFEEMNEFFKENCPDLIENPRCGVLLRGVGLDLPDMRCEIEAFAAIPKERLKKK